MRGLLRRPEGKVPEAAIDRPSENLTVPCPDFSLERTLASGQVFRWREDPSGTFSSWIDRQPVRLRQQGTELSFHGVPAERIERYFALDLDLSSIARQIDVDPIIHQAIQSHWGLRVIRQEPWEALSAFILSAFNNTRRLTGMLNQLSSRFGEHCFPRPEKLAGVSERVLRNCGLGYRAPYLKAAAAAVAGGRADLKKWSRLEDEELRRNLLGIPGIGEKVVECVMLFGYGRAAAFPVDVWIDRVMRAWYFRGKRKLTARKMREFGRLHFGPHCGWAQQYLFTHARALGKNGTFSFPRGLKKAGKEVYQ